MGHVNPAVSYIHMVNVQRLHVGHWMHRRVKDLSATLTKKISGID